MDDINIVLLVVNCALLVVLARFASQFERRLRLMERMDDMHVSSFKTLSESQLAILNVQKNIVQSLDFVDNKAITIAKKVFAIEKQLKAKE